MQVKEILIPCSDRTPLRGGEKSLGWGKSPSEAAFLMSGDLLKLKYREPRVQGHYSRRLGLRLKKCQAKQGHKNVDCQILFNAGQMDVTGLYPFPLSIRWRWNWDGDGIKSGDLLNLLVKNTDFNCSIFILTAAYALLILLLKRNTAWT